MCLQGQGLGNAFLSNIAAVDGIFHVCRAFDDADVVHVEDRVDPVEGEQRACGDCCSTPVLGRSRIPAPCLSATVPVRTAAVLPLPPLGLPPMPAPYYGGMQAWFAPVPAFFQAWTSSTRSHAPRVHVGLHYPPP